MAGGKWHYQMLSWWVETWLDGKKMLGIENELNRLGDKGWELVSFIYCEKEQSAVAVLRLQGRPTSIVWKAKQLGRSESIRGMDVYT